VEDAALVELFFLPVSPPMPVLAAGEAGSASTAGAVVLTLSSGLGDVASSSANPSITARAIDASIDFRVLDIW
jgi:hypothetical protein